VKGRHELALARERDLADLGPLGEQRVAVHPRLARGGDERCLRGIAAGLRLPVLLDDVGAVREHPDTERGLQRRVIGEPDRRAIDRDLPRRRVPAAGYRVLASRDS
jgi:hypothetical protein